MAAFFGTDAVVRRPSIYAVAGTIAVCVAAVLLLAARDRPPTPAAREGSSFQVLERRAVVEDSGVAAVDAVAQSVGASRVAVATGGQLIFVDRSTGASPARAGGLPVTQPLLSVPDGLVAVSEGQAVFVSSNGDDPPVLLGPTTRVFGGPGSSVWLSHNVGGPQYVERVDLSGGERVRFDLAFGVLVHGLVDSGLLLGRSDGTDVVEPATPDEPLAVLPRYASVLSVQGDVVVGTDVECRSNRCNLLIHDVSTGTGDTWDLGGFRLPNRPIAALSPSGEELAIWLVDTQRNLSVGVIDLATGELQRGLSVGSSRASAELAWSRDGSEVIYIDPLTTGVVRVLRPFDDQPSDVALAGEFGSVISVADAG